MAIDPRTPVLVGAALVQQRGAEPGDGLDAIDLMARALQDAADDAGRPALLDALQLVAVPEGTGGWADPGRLVAEASGAGGEARGTQIRTVRADVGVLQQDLLTEVCAQIARGELDVAAVVGGEAKHRAAQAAAGGVALEVQAEAPGARPDLLLSPTSLGVHDLEIERHAVTPATSYALIEHAIGHALGRDPAEHRRRLGELWAGFAAVAAGNPQAWDRSGPDAATITEPTAANRVLAWPYTKLLCSQWNVDQADALVLCSAAVAEAHGVPRDRWVFPHVAASSAHAVPVLQRGDLAACPGADLAAARALELAGLTADDLAVVDLYSCFPSAVQLQARALGLSTSDPRALTVTGGMTFGGGPLNNYALHALATLVPRLRAEPSARGLSTSISGFLVKQGVGIWSAEPPAAGFRHEDVSSAVAARTQVVPVAADHVGPARVASWTVAPGLDGLERVVAVCDVGVGADRARTIATSTDAALARIVRDRDGVGHVVEISPGGELRVTAGPA